MALRVGPKGLFGELVAAYVGLCRTFRGLIRTDGRAALAVLERKGHWFRLVACFLSALNNQLRTGADKGNPTV